MRTARSTPEPSARDAGGDGWPLGPEPHDVLARPGHAPGGRARRPAGGPRRRPRVALPRRRRRWRAATPARRPARTTPRPARGRRAPPTSCAGCGPSRRAGGRAATSARSCCGARAPRPPPSEPPRASRPRPTSRPAPGARPARRQGRCRRRTRPDPARRGRRRAWTAWPSISAPPRCGGLVTASGRRGRAHGGGRLHDRLPPRAPAEVGAAAPVDVTGCRPAARRTTMPGVQNPHWLAPVAAKAPAHRSASARPSRVVTARPAMRAVGVTHATRGAPSTRTVQHPHWPWGLHPSLTECSRRRSRSASSSDPPSSGTVVAACPFRVKATVPGTTTNSRLALMALSRRTFLVAGAGALVLAAAGRRRFIRQRQRHRTVSPASRTARSSPAASGSR